MKNTKKHLFFTATQKALDFLAANTDGQFTEKEISEATGVKKSAVNLALRDLVNEKLILKKKIGRTSLYNADKDDLLIKEIKILQNILILSPLIEALRSESQKIILFGSSAKGENTSESDIDIFVLSNNTDKVRKIVNSSAPRDKIQLIAKTPKEMLLINRQKPFFYQEIERGKTLLENYEK